MTREEAIRRIKAWNLDSDDMEVLTEVIPELRESEDERIRKDLIAFLIDMKDGDVGCFPSQSLYQRWIAWLEKQKEQKPYTDFVIKPHKGDDNNPYDMRVSEAQEYAINRGFGIPFNDGEVYVDERHMTQTIGNILRWADEHPKEQKPEDYNEYKMLIDGAREDGKIKGRKEVIDHPDEYGLTKQKPAEYLPKRKVYDIMNKLTELSTSDLIPIESEEYVKIHEITSDVCSLLDYPIEQKPVITGNDFGWIDELKHDLEHPETLDKKVEEALKLRKIVKEALKQKPVEWSEEDEKMLNEVLDSVTYAFYDQGNEGEIEDYPAFLWLHRLRPHWKPSEEQMEAFKGYIKDFQEKAEAAVGGWNNFDVMIRLYEQLKKLVEG